MQRMMTLAPLGFLTALLGPSSMASAQPQDAMGTVVRGLSWDILGGGVPQGGAIGQLELGFSGLPRISYHQTLDRGLSVGGLVAFDLGHWSPSLAISTALQIAGAVRYTILKDAKWSIGLRGEPGISFGFTDGFRAAIHVLVNASVGYAIENRFLFGAAIDAPALLSFPSGRQSTSFALPLLLGPWFEAHISPPLAITVEVKLGPHLNTAGTTLGLQTLLGVAYRL